jgi:hypothetical protein
VRRTVLEQAQDCRDAHPQHLRQARRRLTRRGREDGRAGRPPRGIQPLVIPGCGPRSTAEMGHDRRDGRSALGVFLRRSRLELESDEPLVADDPRVVTGLSSPRLPIRSSRSQESECKRGGGAAQRRIEVGAAVCCEQPPLVGAAVRIARPSQPFARPRCTGTSDRVRCRAARSACDLGVARA